MKIKHPMTLRHPVSLASSLILSTCLVVFYIFLSRSRAISLSLSLSLSRELSHSLYISCCILPLSLPSFLSPPLSLFRSLVCYICPRRDVSRQSLTRALSPSCCLSLSLSRSLSLALALTLALAVSRRTTLPNRIDARCRGCVVRCHVFQCVPVCSSVLQMIRLQTELTRGVAGV